MFAEMLCSHSLYTLLGASTLEGNDLHLTFNNNFICNIHVQMLSHGE